MQLRTVTLTALFAVTLMARAGNAQTSRPTRSAADSGSVTAGDAAPANAGVVIRRPSDASPTTRQAAATKSAVGFDTQRVLLSLVIVLALIFVLRYLSQRMFGKTVAGRSSRAVQVLSRNVISPKQQLLVVRVGRRLVVVGDSGQQMNALCEITDPDEMAALIGQLHEERRESGGNPFGAIFGRAGAEFGNGNANEPPRPVDVADEEDGSTGPSGVDETRDELNGLMDKVRGMSRQFRRT
jgi:flagellar biogenesis protein FliO